MREIVAKLLPVKAEETLRTWSMLGENEKLQLKNVLFMNRDKGYLQASREELVRMVQKRLRSRKVGWACTVERAARLD